MIQLKIYKKNAGIPNTNLVYLDIADKWITSDPDTKWVLCELTSQFTGESVAFHVAVDWTNYQRYVEIGVVTTRGTSPPADNDIVELGTTNRPLGFYDIKFYQNTDGSNLDPTGLNVLFTGIANLTQDESVALLKGTPPVEYTEYTTNDADTESIYITN